MEKREYYSFPDLKIPEIVQCMNDLQIPFSEDDIRKPSPARVVALLDTFLDMFMGISREQLSQPNFTVMEMLEYPDLHQDSLALMAFYRQVHKLMRELNFPNFSFRDILKPEPPRVKLILSALINFAKFREDRMAVFEQCTQKSDEINEQKQVLDQSNIDVAEKVNNLRLQRAEEEPAIQKAKEVNTGLKNELRELKKQETALSADVEQFKKEKANSTDKLADTNTIIEATKQESARVQSRIVQHPEKLKQAIADMTVSVSNEKNAVSQLEKKAREIQSKIEMMGVVESDVTSCVSAIGECNSEIKKYEEAMKKVQNDKENIDRKQVESKEHNLKEQQMRRQVNTAQEKITRLQRHQATKRETVEMKLAKLREEYNAIADERSNQQTKIDENRRIVEDMEKKIVELQQHMDLEMGQIQNEYNKLKTQIEYYQKELLTTLIPNQA